MPLSHWGQDWAQSRDDVWTRYGFSPISVRQSLQTRRQSQLLQWGECRTAGSPWYQRKAGPRSKVIVLGDYFFLTRSPIHFDGNSPVFMHTGAAELYHILDAEKLLQIQLSRYSCDSTQRYPSPYRVVDASIDNHPQSSDDGDDPALTSRGQTKKEPQKAALSALD